MLPHDPILILCMCGASGKFNGQSRRWKMFAANGSTAFLLGQQPAKERPGDLYSTLYMLPPGNPIMGQVPHGCKHQLTQNSRKYFSCWASALQGHQGHPGQFRSPHLRRNAHTFAEMLGATSTSCCFKASPVTLVRRKDVMPREFCHKFPVSGRKVCFKTTAIFINFLPQCGTDICTRLQSHFVTGRAVGAHHLRKPTFSKLARLLRAAWDLPK